MIIDSETFTELAVHLKLASDAILQSACYLHAFNSVKSQSEEDAVWKGAIESMMAVNKQITVMEKLLRAVMDANKESQGNKNSPLPC